MLNKDYCFGSPNVVSISSVCNEEIAKVIRQSDYIRYETFRRLKSIPSYPIKSLKWKNKYYDYFKKQIENELAQSCREDYRT